MRQDAAAPPDGPRGEPAWRAVSDGERRQVTVVAFSSLGAYAFCLYALGPIITLLRDELGLSDAMASLHSALWAAGTIATGLLYPSDSAHRRWTAGLRLDDRGRPVDKTAGPGDHPRGLARSYEGRSIVRGVFPAQKPVQILRHLGTMRLDSGEERTRLVVRLPAGPASQPRAASGVGCGDAGEYGQGSSNARPGNIRGFLEDQGRSRDKRLRLHETGQRIPPVAGLRPGCHPGHQATPRSARRSPLITISSCSHRATIGSFALRSRRSSAAETPIT